MLQYVFYYYILCINRASEVSSTQPGVSGSNRVGHPNGNGDPKPDSPQGIPLLGIKDGRDLLPMGRLMGKIPSPSGVAGSGMFPMSRYPKPAYLLLINTNIQNMDAKAQDARSNIQPN